MELRLTCDLADIVLLLEDEKQEKSAAFGVRSGELDSSLVMGTLYEAGREHVDR